MNLENLNAFYQQLQTLEFRIVSEKGGTPVVSIQHYQAFSSLHSDELSRLRELALTLILSMSPEQIQSNANRLKLIYERISSFLVRLHNENMPTFLQEFSLENFLSTFRLLFPVNLVKKIQELHLELETVVYKAPFKDAFTGEMVEPDPLPDGGYYDLTYKVIPHYEIDDASTFIADIIQLYETRKKQIFYLLYQIQSITGIKPNLFNSAEERAEEEEKFRQSPLSLKCLLSEKQVEILHKRLIENRLFDKAASIHTFNNVLFGDVALAEPIKWLGRNRVLSYLFRQMHSCKFMDNPNWQSVLDRRKVFKNDKGKLLNRADLAQALSDVQKLGNPDGADIIDSILSEIRSMKD